jgi:hypothetical protein
MSKTVAKAKAPKPEKVAPKASIAVPIRLMLAAMACCSKDDPRAYTSGVYLHAVKRSLRIAATDGHRLFIASYDVDQDAKVPAWVEDGGVILPSEGMKPRLAMIKGEQSLAPEQVKVTFGKDHPTFTITDPADRCIFKMYPIDGKFPDYERIIEQSSFSAEGRGDFEPVGFNGQYLKAVGDIAKVLEVEAVAIYASKVNEAAVITFPSFPGAVLYLMPTRIEPQMPRGTAAILGPAIRSSIAALRAHETRNRDWAKEASNAAERDIYNAKADEFRRRIEAMQVHANMRKALPAPAEAAPADPGAAETPAVSDTPADAAEAPPAEAPARQADPVIPRAANRSVARGMRKAAKVLKPKHRKSA